MAFWEWKRWAVLSMLSLSLPQWAIITWTMMVVQASWDDQSGICVVVDTNHVLLNLKYVYSKWSEFFVTHCSSSNMSAMAFDFVILVMTIIALRKRFRDEALSNFLLRDGLIYFLIMSTCNTVPAVGLFRCSDRG